MQKLPAYIRQALSSSFDNSEAICFPTLWIANPVKTKSKGDDAANIALKFYKTNGLVGDIGDKNGYCYAAILRDLLLSSPWVKDDCFWDTEQKVKHRPFLLDAIENNDDTLLEKFRCHYENIDPPFFGRESEITKMFCDKIALARLLGSMELFLNLYKSVFADVNGSPDGFFLAAGAPDLLVWYPDKDNGFWFLSEVKAHGDYLSHSQKSWLDRNWDLVRGHYLLTVLQ